MDITQVFELPQSTFDAVQIHLFFVPVINYWWGAFKVHIKNWFQTINLFLPQNLVSLLPALDYGEGVYINQLPTVLYSVYHCALKFVVASSTAVYCMLIIPSLNVRWYTHWMVSNWLCSYLFLHLSLENWMPLWLMIKIHCELLCSSFSNRNRKESIQFLFLLYLEWSPI